MDRLINVKVSGSHLWKDSNLAGVQGESNVNRLRITFDEGWDGYAKRVTFWDALGGEPVERTLTADLLEDITQSIRIYLCPIPGEAMAEAGLMTFVVEGYVDGKRARAVGAELEVEYAPIADHAGQPVDPTPTQAEQLQGQIENILSDMQAEAILADDAAKAAQASAAAAKTSEGKAADSEEAAAASEKNAKASEEAAEKAQQAIEGMTVTGETVPADSTLPEVEKTVNQDGSVNLHFAVRQGVSGVYVGEGEMPEGFYVQVNPEGEGYALEALIRESLEAMLEVNLATAKIGEVTLKANAWVGTGNLYSQVVEIAGVTEHSQVDLTPDVAQLAVFYEKDLTFVTENDGGVVTVYAIGQKPINDYTIQVTITEVNV